MPEDLPKKKGHPRRVQKVGTTTIVVKADNEADVTKACHKILAFVKKVDRYGVVNVTINGTTVQAVEPEAGDEDSMLD